MKFCKNCGKELKADAQFCKECGTPVQGQKNMEAENNKAIPDRTPMSPKKKKWLIAGVTAAVVLFGAYKIGENLFSKERLITNFEKALVDYDEKAVAGLLYSNDKKLDINKDTVKSFVKYYKENPDQIKITVENLRKQAQQLDAQQNTGQYLDSYNSAYDLMVNLHQDGKFLFYDKYELMIDSVYLTIETNYKDTELYVNNKKVDKTDEADFEKAYGPYVPGIHNVEAKLETEFVDLVTEDSVTAYGGAQPTADLYLDGEDVYIDTSIDSDEVNLNGKLYINGKDVGVNPFQEEEFGPVLTDGTMKMAVEVELPWGTIKTKEKEIDSKYMDIDLSEHDETQKNIMNTVVQSYNESLTALEKRDTSYMTTFTSEQKQIAQEELEELGEAQEYEEISKVKYLGATFDLDSFSISNEDEKWIAEVDALIKIQHDYYYEGETPELEDESGSYTFTLIYDEKAKKWLIDSMDSVFYFDDENVKEIKEQSPKEYTIRGF